MPWPSISLFQRRQQVRDDIAQHMPGADASVPNGPLRIMGDAQASLTHDNDLHLDWVARMMMPDTAEGEYADRWGSIWLKEGRKPATFAIGPITVTGQVGAVVPHGARLVASVRDEVTGGAVTVDVVTTMTLALTGGSAVVAVEALVAGGVGNLPAGTILSWLEVPAGLDGQATVSGSGLAYGVDAETDARLIERYIDRIQEPPHGGNAHDYVQWMLEVPGVTRAWARQEMGIGTVTCRFLMDDVRAGTGGLPTDADLAIVRAYLDKRRPVTVADMFVVAPVPQPFNLTIADLVGDTPIVRANIQTELAMMLRARALPGQRIYASWIGEAVSAATGEDHHELTITDIVPASAGHLVTLGTITYA